MPLTTFNNWFDTNWKGKQIPSSLPIEKRLFLSEMFTFYSVANTIWNSFTQQQHDDQIFEYKQLIYPQLRRLLEFYFRAIYIFEDLTNTAQISTRINDYLAFVRSQYNKMWNDINSNEQSLIAGGFGSVINPMIPKLPPKMQPARKDTIYGNVSNLLRNTHRNGPDMSALYTLYRITSFYSHGDINFEIMADFSPTGNMNFPIIKTEKALDLMASEYEHLIKELSL